MQGQHGGLVRIEVTWLDMMAGGLQGVQPVRPPLQHRLALFQVLRVAVVDGAHRLPAAAFAFVADVALNGVVKRPDSFSAETIMVRKPCRQTSCLVS